ncbi:MAG: OmpA family protein [Flavobacteriaceae bacterium]|nr:OmpA family protein [Flavobacteriaceae bacterium]
MKRLFFIVILFTQLVFTQNELKHEVYFDTDKYDVPETEKNRLLLFIQNLHDIDINKISIYGFCDDRGTSSYNQVLSQNRANSIKTVFSNNEIDQDLITNVDGKGEILLKIVKEDDINKIRGLNRKVEIIVVPKIEEVVEKNSAEDEKKKKTIYSNELKKGDKLTLDKLLFKTGYSYLMPESKPVLKRIADTLVKRKELYFTIQGHVCCTQNSRDAVNRKTKQRNLSVARAKYVYDYLLKKGVSKKRMKYVGMRRKFPLGGDPKYDRRVEILITYVAKKKAN